MRAVIITRTPFRISLVGGGTDFPAWFKARRGAVVSVTIDKFCYLTVRRLRPFFSYASRFVYNRVEDVQVADEVVHPAIRGTLKFLGLEAPQLAVHHDSDLPAQSGLGSSAAFTVGLLHALYRLQGWTPSPRRVADDAVIVDQDYAGDVCGVQDQVATAYGGLNLIKFGPGDRQVYSVDSVRADLVTLNAHLLLFYLNGYSRLSSTIEAAKAARDNTRLLLEQTALVDPCLQALTTGDMPLLGRAVSRGWELKRQMAPEVTDLRLDGYCDRALGAGAYGVKVCGAGGGGSILAVAPPEKQQAVIEALGDLVHVSFKLTDEGSRVIYCAEG